MAPQQGASRPVFRGQESGRPLAPGQETGRPVVQRQETYGQETRQKTTYLDEPARQDYGYPAAASELQYYEDEGDGELEDVPGGGVLRPPGQLSPLTRPPLPDRRLSLPPGWPPICKRTD